MDDIKYGGRLLSRRQVLVVIVALSGTLVFTACGGGGPGSGPSACDNLNSQIRADGTQSAYIQQTVTPNTSAIKSYRDDMATKTAQAQSMNCPPP